MIDFKDYEHYAIKFWKMIVMPEIIIKISLK